MTDIIRLNPGVPGYVFDSRTLTKPANEPPILELLVPIQDDLVQADGLFFVSTNLKKALVSAKVVGVSYERAKVVFPPKNNRIEGFPKRPPTLWLIHFSHPEGPSPAPRPC